MGGSAAESVDGSSPGSVDRAVEVLRAGGLVVAPTETRLGLLADPFHAGALRRAVELKQRPREQPFPLILPDAAAVERVAVRIPGLARRLIAACWPGPLTLLLPARDGLPVELVGAGVRVAVRVPGPSPAAEIVRRFGGPLIASSANRRGRPTPASTEALEPALCRDVDLVVTGRSPGGAASTIVAFEGDGYRVVRSGAVPEEALRRTLT